MKNDELWWKAVRRLRAAIGPDAFLARIALWQFIKTAEAEQIDKISRRIERNSTARQEYWESLEKGHE